MEENFSTLKNEMTMSIKEAYRTPNRVDQKRNSSRHIIVKTPNVQKKERLLKAARKKNMQHIKADQLELYQTSQQRL